MQYGKMLALDRLSLSVERGDIYGLIGPNGAGKTPTFKIVATVLKPTAGMVLVEGIDIGREQTLQNVRRQIG